MTYFMMLIDLGERKKKNLRERKNMKETVRTFFTAFSPEPWKAFACEVVLPLSWITGPSVLAWMELTGSLWRGSSLSN